VRIAILDDYHDVAGEITDWSALPPGCDLRIFRDHIFEEDALVTRLREFDIIFGMRERTPFPRSLLTRLPNLKLLITAAMANASFDLGAATDLGIVVGGTEGDASATTAELTWGLIFALTRNIAGESRDIYQGNWGATLGTGLSGKTLGILGLGDIGAQVADVGRAFRMSVIAWSQNMTTALAADSGAILVTKDELFARSDVVTIHVRLTDRTRGLITGRELGRMKTTAYLINTSRGPIVEEGALLDVLHRQSIAGAGLDVFNTEPLPSGHPFLNMDNVVLTPHIGYVVLEIYQRWYRQALENIEAFLSGHPIRVLNPDVLESVNLRSLV
jgi:phosphoglycerate dehydrogenase-like enzyme